VYVTAKRHEITLIQANLRIESPLENMPHPFMRLVKYTGIYAVDAVDDVGNGYSTGANQPMHMICHQNICIDVELQLPTIFPPQPEICFPVLIR
jgi:hypothetical protein